MADARSLDQLLAAARTAALVGGEVILAAGTSPEATTKAGPGDYVTDVDRRSERAIVEALSVASPDVPVVGEEGGSHAGRGDRYWVVDPLDGTTNFLHRFPLVGVSVALVEHGRPVVGVVHTPFLGDTYSAVRGLGAHVERGHGEEARLRVSDRDPGHAVVATGFPFRRKDLVSRYGRMFLGALERFEDLRRPGAASLDLAWVAAGVFDGFFELRLNAWDVAAGGLLVEEAGGMVTDWEGGADYLAGDILAGPPNVHASLLELAEQTT